MLNIGIIGLGLIGGSLAKALKSYRFSECTIIAFDYNIDSLNLAYKEMVIDKFTSEIDDNFSNCDIIFISTLVDDIKDTTVKLSKICKKSCILTDVASSKNKVLADISSLNLDIKFISGHPMTGSERRGYQASKEHLFENSFYILSAISKNVNTNDILLLRSILEKIGAIVIEIDIEKHDYIMSMISHLPHVVASMLVNLVQNNENRDNLLHTLAAGGFKDITRIASSDPKLWKEISINNKLELSNSIALFIKDLEQFKNNLDSNNDKYVFDFFDNAKEYRDSFALKELSSYAHIHPIIIDVIDKPGEIALISKILADNSLNIKNIAILNSREYEGGVMQIILASHEERKKSIKILEESGYEVKAL